MSHVGSVHCRDREVGHTGKLNDLELTNMSNLRIITHIGTDLWVKLQLIYCVLMQVFEIGSDFLLGWQLGLYTYIGSQTKETAERLYQHGLTYFS